MKTRRLIPVFALAAAALVAFTIPAVRRPAVQALGRAAGHGAEARAAARGNPAAGSDTTQTAAGEARAARLPVAGIVLQRAPFVLSVRGTGRAEAVQRAALACRVGELVVAVRVREGQHVQAGDVLVELDRRPFELSLREAQARLAATRMELAGLAFDDTTATPEKRDRMAARTGVTEAEQRVARAALDLEATVLTAPFDGEVTDVAVAVGERAQPERALVTIVDRTRIRVPAEVLEASFARLSPGVRATVRFPALDGAPVEGTVAALAPELDTTRGTGIAYVEFDNRDGRVRPGMYCEVDLQAARYDGRLAVPRPAVLERSRRLLVFVARAGRAEWSYVDTGLESDNEIEVTSGLAPGDTVLVDGHLTLAHGAPVRVTLAGAPLP